MPVVSLVAACRRHTSLWETMVEIIRATRTGETMHSLYDPVQGAKTRGRWAFDSGPPIVVGSQNVGGPLADGEVFETDWEALGFGYRMSGPTQYSGSTPLFADQPGQQLNQQQQQGGFADARSHARRPTSSAGTSAALQQNSINAFSTLTWASDIRFGLYCVSYDLPLQIHSLLATDETSW